MPAVRDDAKYGYVYFIGNEEVKKIKIGRAVNVKKRFSSIQAHSPVILEVFATIKCDMDYERELHNKFKEDRCHGEWFNLSEKILSFIEDLKNKREKQKARYNLPADQKWLMNCKYCNDQINTRKCKICGDTLKNTCRECHLEIAHDKVVIEKDVRFPAHPGPVDIDSDGSWANTVKAYEE